MKTKPFTSADHLLQFVTDHQAARGQWVPDPHPERTHRCVHLGPETGETVDCKTCSGKVSLKVLGCAVHGTCTPTRPQPGHACCHGCPDYKPDVPPPHPNITAASAFALSVPDYPTGQFRGRGIVIVGGGKYFASAYVVARMVRHVGCDLPIEVWYLGAAEWDARIATALGRYGVTVRDALAHPMAPSARNLTGWPGNPPYQAKSFAALRSPFEEVLLLDADSYPCADPTALFDDPAYRATGGVFFPDLPATNAWTRWDQWGVAPFGPACGWEVGQYLIDKRTAWRQINMTRWYDDHGDWCYGWSNHHDHGDKGTWRVAWARFRTEPAFYDTRAKWQGCAFVHAGPDGKPAFVHRCRSKFVLTGSHFASTPQNGVNVRAGLPLEPESFAALEDLRRELA